MPVDPRDRAGDLAASKVAKMETRKSTLGRVDSRSSLHDGPDLAVIGGLTTSLYTEHEQGRRQLLANLLCEEENKFGALSWQHDMARRYIYQANIRIKNQEELIEHLKKIGGHNIELPQAILKNMKQVRELFQKYEALIDDMLSLAENRLINGSDSRSRRMPNGEGRDAG